MDERERDRHWRDTMKYNEFHKGGQKEDRTTREIVEIATALEDGAIIGCVTWLWPNMRLSIVLDNQPLVREVSLAVSNSKHYGFGFVRSDQGKEIMQQRENGPWRNGFDMNIQDVVECFGLDDDKIVSLGLAPTPGTWTGWFLMSYSGPEPSPDGPEH
jgi:hypothetical protein